MCVYCQDTENEGNNMNHFTISLHKSNINYLHTTNIEVSMKSSQ